MSQRVCVTECTDCCVSVCVCVCVCLEMCVCLWVSERLLGVHLGIDWCLVGHELVLTKHIEIYQNKVKNE